MKQWLGSDDGRIDEPTEWMMLVMSGVKKKRRMGTEGELLWTQPRAGVALSTALGQFRGGFLPPAESVLLFLRRWGDAWSRCSA